MGLLILGVFVLLIFLISLAYDLHALAFLTGFSLILIIGIAIYQEADQFTTQCRAAHGHTVTFTRDTICVDKDERILFG